MRFIHVVLWPLILISSLAAPAKNSYELAPSSTFTEVEGKTQLLKKMSNEISAISEEANKALVFVAISKSIKANFNDPLFEFFFGWVFLSVFQNGLDFVEFFGPFRTCQGSLLMMRRV